jgi:hypothetical protein
MKTIDEALNSEREEADAYMRNTVIEALIATVVVGLGLTLLSRLLRPPTARERATRLVQDILDQAQGVSRPALRRARKLVQNGAGLVESGVNRASDLHLDRHVDTVANRVRGFFR